MKNLFPLFILITILAFSACGKENLKHKKDKEGEAKDYTIELCEWDESIEASGSEFEKFVVKDFVINEDCGCISEGMEKFLENGQTKYLIYYAEKDCVGYGFKVTCLNGDCDGKGTKCKFLQDCDEG